MVPTCLSLLSSFFTASACSLKDHRGYFLFSIMAGFMLRWWHMNFESNLEAFYVLQAKTSNLFLKKTNNFSFSTRGNYVPIWKYLSLFELRTIFSSSSHCALIFAVLFETSGTLTVDCYKTRLELRRFTYRDWCLIAATIHCLAMVWHPTSSPTRPSVRYFTLISKVKEIAPIAWSHSLAEIAV